MTNEDFIEAVKRNNQRIYLIAFSFTKSKTDAEDILQNVFLKLWKFPNEFENEIHLDKWLTAVCVNESKNYLKSPFRKKSMVYFEENVQSELESTKNLDLFNAVMSLPKKERAVIHLFYYEDMTVKEIAEVLKIKESAVKTRLHRARKSLKLILGDEWINE
ncbi:MAG: sigma-70 family RNA polymerase sigma factor [Clostridia bacterium]|nr:sigma-70 family RNA polymerase sigma factor [Clostridia bacterium]